MLSASRSIRTSGGICALASLLALPALAEPVRVVATIKPVHSIVSAVMAGVGVPHLIMRGASSPHDFSLRPSDAGKLQDAQVVFLIGDALETSLAGPIANLAGDARVVPLAEAPGLVHRPLREGGHFEVHDHGHHAGHGAGGHEAEQHGEEHGDAHHGHEHHDAGHGDGEHGPRDHDGHGAADHGEHGHGHDEAAHHDGHGNAHHADAAEEEHAGTIDMHVWLDPVNGVAMAQAVADTLAEVDAGNADAYRANAAAFADQLDGLAEQIVTDTAPLRDRPFIVFHDAYRHFEERFGLTAVGSAVVSADRSPGARRLAELREKVRELEVACVLAEPQFDDRVVNVIIEGSDARAGSVDPLGAGLADGPDLYFELLADLATSFKECLSPRGAVGLAYRPQIGIRSRSHTRVILTSIEKSPTTY